MSDAEGLLLAISGPSGVGKTTLTRLLRELAPHAEFSVSATTRRPTAQDTEGVDYFFLSEEAFEKRVREGAFLEHARYAGRRYGTLRSEVEGRLAQGGLVLLDIDVQGAKQIKEAMLRALTLFVLPPDEDALLTRLRGRGREEEAEIQRRFTEAKREIAFARESGVYDHFVINDDAQRAAGEIYEFVRAHGGA